MSDSNKEYNRENRELASNPEKFLERLANTTPSLFPTGSHYICSPSKEGTDVDYMVHVYYSQLEAFCRGIEGIGWVKDSIDDEPYSEKPFLSYRNGRFNLLITSEETYYRKFKLATEVCKKLNVQNKADRIMVFHAITDEAHPDSDGNCKKHETQDEDDIPF